MHDLILKNFWLKVFSLMLATTMWYVLQPSTESEPRYLQNPFRPSPITREFNCPVTLLVAPAEHPSYQVEPTNVTIKVSGDPSILNELDPEDIKAYVNVSTIHAPQGAFPVEAFVPKEVVVRSLSPTHVYIKP
jgi:hypothetical protein